MSMSPFLSWVLMLSLAVLAWLGASRFGAWLDRVMSDDLSAARRRDEALKVMERWHPSQGPRPVHSVNAEADARHAACTCRTVLPGVYDPDPWARRVPDPSCPVHKES